MQPVWEVKKAVWEHTEEWFRLAGTGMLIILSVWDVKKQEIPGAFPLLIGIGAAIFRGPGLIAETLMGAVPGGVLMFMGFLCHGQIGIGDGVMAACMGMLLGGRESLETILLSFGFVFIFSCVGLVLRKLTRKSRLPFVPFYLAAYIGVVYL